MSAETLAILFSGAFLLFGMLTGVWKYRQVMASPEHKAHPYVDIAHRASLLYAFACLVLAEYADRSPLPEWLTLICVIAPLLFFVIAVAAYVMHGLKQDTDNQFRKPTPLTVWTMNALIVAEVGGFGILFIAVAWSLVSA
jgi:uncharacterized membrane protein YhdT